MHKALFTFISNKTNVLAFSELINNSRTRPTFVDQFKTKFRTMQLKKKVQLPVIFVSSIA